MRVDGDELRNLLLEHEISVPRFAVVECDNLNPQTVYAAIACKKLAAKSFKKISEAMDRLRQESVNSKAAG